jgi:hypothetical protein
VGVAPKPPPRRPARPGLTPGIQQALTELQQDPAEPRVLERLSPNDLLLLQSAIGNRAVTRIGTKPLPKLPGDPGQPAVAGLAPEPAPEHGGHTAAAQPGWAAAVWSSTQQGAQSAWASTKSAVGRAGRSIGGLFRRRGKAGGAGGAGGPGPVEASPAVAAPASAGPGWAAGAWDSTRRGAQTAWDATTKAMGSAWQATSSAVSTAAGAVTSAFSGGGGGGGGSGGGGGEVVVSGPVEGAFQGGSRPAPVEGGGGAAPPERVQEEAPAPDPLGAAVAAELEEAPPEARLTLLAYLAQNPPARPSGAAPVPSADTDQVKLSATLRKVASAPAVLPRTLGDRELKAWIATGGNDGGTPAARTKQLESLAKLVNVGKAVKGTQVPEQRALLARNLLLSYLVYGLGSYDQAAALGRRLNKTLGAASYSQLPEATRGALAAIGFNANLERMVLAGGAEQADAIARVVRAATNGLTEEEEHVAKYLGMTVPNFLQLVPEVSRSTLGQQVSQVNRLRARIVWQHEVRNLGPLPDLPPSLTEDDSILKIGEAAQQYRGIVNALRIKSNQLLPAEVAAASESSGASAEDRAKQKAKVETLVANRGDLFAHGSGAQEQRGERYMPERAPFGLALAQATRTRPGQALPEGDIDPSQLAAQHRAELDDVRAQMRTMLAARVPTFLVQQYASEMIDLLLKQMHVEALQEMQAAGWGTPPTEYAFLALGSGGRHEATTFGDLDFALVVGSKKQAAQGPGGQKKTSQQYFQELGERMKQKVYGLKERGPTAVLGEKQRKGLRICEGGVFPASSGQFEYGKTSLIGTVEDLAAIQRKPGFITMGDVEFNLGEDAEVFDALREPRFAFGSEGGAQLAQTYTDELAKVMTEKADSGQTRGVEAGKAAIKGASDVHLPDPAAMDGGTIELKKLYRAVQLYVKGLCMMVNLQVTNSRKRVQELMQGGQLSPDVGGQVIEALDVLTSIRTKAHLTTLEQNDAVTAVAPEQSDGDEGNGYVLTDTELEQLKHVVAVVIPALAKVATDAVARPPQPAARKQASGGFEISGPR